MNIKTTLKLSVTAAALFAIAAPVATPASADDVKSATSKNTLTVSGQVVRALWYGDDGTNDQLFNTSGATTNSRVRWVAAGTVTENVTMGATIEMDIPDSQNIGAATFGSGAQQDTGADDNNWSIRHEYVWINHKKFGKLSLGQTDAAANGNTEANLSGASGMSNTAGQVWAGSGIFFMNKASGTATPTTVTPGSVVSNLDFTSRTDVIRYDTPNFMGFSLAASIDGAGGGEIGGRYSGKFGPVNVVALAGYSELSAKSTTNDHIVGGSVAALHDSGINASFTYATQEKKTGGTDVHFWSGGLGYKAKIFKIGGTNFRVGYTRTLHNSRRGDNAETWGIDVSQDIAAVGANVSLIYRNYDFENNRQSLSSIDSIDVFGIQTLFKF